MKRYEVRMSVVLDSWAKDPRDAARRCRGVLKGTKHWNDAIGRPDDGMGAEVVSIEESQVTMTERA